MFPIQSWLLNFIYATIVVVGSPWLLWRFIRGKSRRGWRQKLFGSIAPFSRLHASDSQDASNWIWIHAVSVGEVNLLGSILQEIAVRDTGIKFAISTTTETGYDLAKSKYPECYVFFCPFDFTWAITRVIKRLKPSAIILTELEIWPNLIATADRLKVPVVVANGRLSEKSARGYRRVFWLVESSFKKLSLVLCQTNSYAERFVKLGCNSENVRVTGNVKFDGIQTDRQNAATRKLVRLSGIADSNQVFLAGSTQLEEDLIAAKVYQSLAKEHPELRLILAPRHPQRVGELVNRLKQLGIETRLRSELGFDTLESDNPAKTPKIITRSVSEGSSFAYASGRDGGSQQNSKHHSEQPVLIIDVIGELGAWWGRADIAYVGGSMGPREGQNMIEPAAYGTPVSFGPRTKNFKDLVTELLVNDAATVVKNEPELRSFVSRCLDSPDDATRRGQLAQQVVVNHAGASAKTVDAVFKLIGRMGNELSRESTSVSDAA